eukprot:gnl/MRDRNA2_/MRDRNA2_128428_c0_seq1.p1 gnl/MRDRNA2_/MRDRNA2_128428_c0~~gnl/MRDRNA2_/MRDRNA2_128428_c0_seq1.p1  ORF type:complete len:406 (+),score=59.20 gnl/MRDRNA2_/MRDRNA2_128428_c0_seq1:109-1326(+)
MSCVIVVRSSVRQQVSSGLVKLERNYASGRTEHSSEALRRLERRHQRIASLQKRLVLPKVSGFQARGQYYDLPWKGDESEEAFDAVTRDELDYLVGFFDGDGCVHAQSDLSGCRVKISQTWDKGEVLLHFMDVFGGGIYNQSSAQGAWKHKLEWVVAGKKAQRSASFLASRPSLKSSQLQIAAAWPKCPHVRRGCDTELRRLKRAPHPEHVECTWPYLAGFFDAEGCIRISPICPAMSLTIVQKHKPVLSSIQQFLKSEHPEGTSAIYEAPGHYRLMVTQTDFSRHILNNMLTAGLIVKQRSAQLALTLTKENHFDVRDGLAELSGNQKRYFRLDQKGCKMSRLIKNLRAKLSYHTKFGNTPTVHSIELELKEAMSQFAFHKATTSLALLRTDVRSMLRQGAYCK